ncbi:MAG: hypothetical protein ACI39W_02505 [Brotaphodocola sp.]
MKYKKCIYYGLPVLGILFCLWYVKAATCDVVYTDYIRLVNSYLPDVWNPAKFFVPDVLTRIPIHYLGRIINTTFFHYSTTFDMALGVLGLGISGVVLGMYCEREQVGAVWYLLLTFLLFGLNKWEMLTNGTGWGHFAAFAGFYYHYLVFDRLLYGQGKRHDRRLLLVLPAVITLGMAGPYCAVYTVVMVLAYLTAWMMRRDSIDRKFCIVGIVSVLIPFFLYLWSNSYAVEDHAGAVEIGLLELAAADFSFFVRFLLKSLASMVVGAEVLDSWMAAGVIRESVIYGIGACLAASYLFALVLNWKFRLYERTLMPLMLLFAGMGNHAIVLMSRYIFVKDHYGMSSRYALQYQAGLLGIMLTFALLWNQWKMHKNKLCRAAAGAICLMLLAGHSCTDYAELKKAPYREQYGRNIEAVAVQFESVSDDVLRETFDYRKSQPDSGEKVREALTILKEQKWNVFSR